MKVVLQDNFLKKLNRQIAYIAWDKPSAARKFKNELLFRLRKIQNQPYANRKSIYFDNDLIRDLVFGNYTIVYLINEKQEVISVFELVRGELTP